MKVESSFLSSNFSNVKVGEENKEGRLFTILLKLVCEYKDVMVKRWACDVKWWWGIMFLRWGEKGGKGKKKKMKFYSVLLKWVFEYKFKWGGKGRRRLKNAGFHCTSM